MALHTSIRIDGINPVHVRISVFTGNTPDGMIPSAGLTRGLSGTLEIKGDLVLNTKVVEDFILGYPGLVRIISGLPESEIKALLPRVHKWMAKQRQNE